jgi:cytochrome bd-type quinol oxidase subunit 2
MDHFLLLLVQAVLIAVFFAFLWKRDSRERRKYLLKVLAALILGAIALGWLMYPFPRP